MRVMTIMLTEFDVRDPEVLAAAVLHDTIEDTSVDRNDICDEFGERVASYVVSLTKDMRLPDDEREAAYIEVLANAPLEVKLCKLADLLDNLKDSAALSIKSRKNTAAKARRIAERFARETPPDWEPILDRVFKDIQAAESSAFGERK